ncbi:hypothetical protein BLNAU_17108 [Blattamonas nauphoetae]|uniref:Uncharacterized protein n=1 Tax=Blattamonas nauphoetae TaxID=2049346 RepID=A0ABQ9X9B1_9EUKA|nr:hypothetical protein BLNAU_17108 [Blattamonas nauphoetae]
MGNTINERLQENRPEPYVLSDDELITLLRRLQIIVDSCVGVLHRNDFLDFDRDLDNDKLRNLSRFLYLSFPTIRDKRNELAALKPYLFRSAILSIFGHIVVNAMTYIKRGTLNTGKEAKESDTSRKPFLHVVTGTPGIGKSASRYPFITLLMGFGVEAITTKRSGECAFLFERKSKSKAGIATITTKGPYREDIEHYIQSYLNYYNVYKYPLDQGTKPNDSSTGGDIYFPAGLEKDQVLMGQLIVPSVEYFPRFLHLVFGGTNYDFKKPEEIQEDITITAQSVLKKGSEIAKDSVLHVVSQTLMKPMKLRDTTTLGKHSILCSGSELLEESKEPTKVESGSIYLHHDMVLEANSVIATGSVLVHQGKTPIKRSFSETQILEDDITIGPGSIIKATSNILPDSSLVHGYSVQNKLENTKWHIIDDLTIASETGLPETNHCVLFTSPNEERWHKTNEDGRSMHYFIAEYVVPKYSLQEEAAFLNAIGQDAVLQETHLAELEKGAQLFSFIPRFILDPDCSKSAFELVHTKDPKKLTELEREKIFGSYVSHKLVHFSCPQYDCHNWFVQFATDNARQFVLDMFNLHSTSTYHTFLTSMTDNVELNQKKGAIFHNFVLDAIDGGFYIDSPTRLVSEIPLRCPSFHLPTILGESNIYLRSSTNIRRAYLPDISRIDPDSLSPFLNKYNILFENPMDPCLSFFTNHRDLSDLMDAQTSESVPPVAGMATRSNRQMITPTPNSPLNSSDSTSSASSLRSEAEFSTPLSSSEAEFSTSLSSSEPGSPDFFSSSEAEFSTSLSSSEAEPPDTSLNSEAESPDAKCFTYSLNPLGANNAGFDSIILFFKVHMDKTTMIVDALSVIFIQSTLAPTHKISPSGSNLMFLWLHLFSDIYNLSPSVIFPFLFFVKSPFVEKFSKDGDNTTEFFMDEKNIWVMNGYAKTVDEVTVKCTGRLILDSNISLIPNTNPYYYRCCFCGLLLKENFMNHNCDRLRTGITAQTSAHFISSPWKTYASEMGQVGVYDRLNPHEHWALLPGARSVTNVAFHLAMEREQGPCLVHCSLANCGRREMTLNYPTVGFIPNSRSGRTNIDPFDIILIKPTKDRSNLFPLANVSSEPEPYTSLFRVDHYGPILDLFSYFPRPNVATTVRHIVDYPLVQTDIPRHDSGARGNQTANERHDSGARGNQTANESAGRNEDPEAAPAEVNYSEYRMYALLSMIRLWGKKKAIGFTKIGETSYVCEVDDLQPSNKDVVKLCEDKSIPLPQLYVPMDCLNRLPVSLYGTRTLVPFEIKCLLAGDSLGDTSDTEYFSIKKHLECGLQMSLNTLKKLAGDDINKKHLLTKCLNRLHSLLKNMAQISMSDFQMLVSYVNGLPLIIADILQLCIDYLSCYDQLTPRQLDFLICYLKNPITRKKEIINDLASSNPEKRLPTWSDLQVLQNRASKSLKYFSTDRSSFIGSLDEEPTFDDSTLQEINGLSQIISKKERGKHNQNVLLAELESKNRQIQINLDFMEILLKNGMTIVKKQLQLFVDHVIKEKPSTDFTDEDKAVLLDRFRTNPLLYPWHHCKLIPFFTDASHIQTQKPFLIKTLSSKDRELQPHETDLLVAFLTIQTPLKDEETKRLISLVNDSKLKNQDRLKNRDRLKNEGKLENEDKPLLINLITGELKSGATTYHRLSNTSIKNYDKKWNDAMSNLESNELQKLDRNFLCECLNKQKPLNDYKMKELSLIVDRTTLSACSERNTLKSMITGKPLFSCSDRQTFVCYYLRLRESGLDKPGRESEREQVNKELARSDQTIAIKCVFYPLLSAERDLRLLFSLLRGTGRANERRREELITKMSRTRESILLTMKDRFKRLGRDHLFSWNDLASLLCCPNGSESKYLIGIQSLVAAKIVPKGKAVTITDLPSRAQPTITKDTTRGVSETITRDAKRVLRVTKTNLEGMSTPLPLKRVQSTPTKQITDKRQRHHSGRGH